MLRRRSLQMRWLGIVLGMGLLLYLPARPAAAHPLGNFTINRYSRLEFAAGAVQITYVVDFAEIPTFQQLKRLDPDGDGALAAAAAAYLDAELPALVGGLRLTVGERALPLAVRERSATILPGQGGLPTLRLEVRLLADLPAGWQRAGTGTYTDRNYQDRLGWREIVVRGGPGVAIAGSSAPADDLSNELRQYPEDLLSSPLARSEATFALVPEAGPAASDTGGRAAQRVRDNRAFGGGRATDRVASLIAIERLTPTVVLIALLLALCWGAAHALTPGHGKAVVAAYLVGARGTARHAAFLGLTVTLTHTIGVFALGLVTLYLSRYLLPETLYPWLNVVSGMLVVAIGLTLARQRLRGLFAGDGRPHAHHHDHHDHHGHGYDRAHFQAHDGYAHTHADGDHVHAHDQSHGHRHDGHPHAHGGPGHSHLPPGADGSRVTWRSLLALGVSGGLVPCPSALVLLLSAISLDRLEFGMVLVLAFSAGLALVLTGIGLVCVYARQRFARVSFEPRIPRLLPVTSALAIALAGLLIVLGALRQAGVV